MKYLKCEPEEVLTFPTNGTNPSRVLQLTNNHSTSVAFKVKTTAPKAYLVRPCAGILKPKASQDINIILQPNQGEASSHRFLVQAAAVPNSTETLARDAWSTFPKEQVQETRLSVSLEAGDDSNRMSTVLENSSSRPAGGGESSDLALQAKYEELYQYTCTLEKAKKEVERELTDIQLKLKDGSKGGGSSSMPAIPAILGVLLGLLLAYIMMFMGSK
mmetsp:Transcript_92806/g.193989  ORF Transcript_92806/g.193989 Transcript_92806/m.193989 type:complete len:217 (-) Transcript_92806:115-765(-)